MGEVVDGEAVSFFATMFLMFGRWLLYVHVSGGGLLGTVALLLTCLFRTYVRGLPRVIIAVVALFFSCVCRLSCLLLCRVCCTLWAPCGALSCSVPGWIFVSFQRVWLRLSIDECSHTSTRGHRQDDPALFSGAFLVWSALSLRLEDEVE